MKKIFLLFPVIAIVFYSCQKEVDLGLSSSGNTANQKLVRVATRSGADTFTTDYGYNTNGKVIREYTFGTVTGQSFTSERTFVRNSGGIITRIILKGNQLLQLGLDSIVTHTSYNSSISRYSSSVYSVSVFGFVISDSTAYTYDAAGQLTREESFTNTAAGGYQPNSRTQYTYLANGNLAASKTFSYNLASGIYELSIEYNFEYDTKANPLRLGIDAVVFGNPGNDAVNNTTKESFIDSTDPSNNETTTIAFTYNAANKPVKSNAVITPLGNTYFSNYTYK